MGLHELTAHKVPFPLVHDVISVCLKKNPEKPTNQTNPNKLTKSQAKNLVHFPHQTKIPM